MGDIIKDLKDIVGFLNNGVVGSGGINGIGHIPGAGNNNFLGGINASTDRSVNSKLFNQLMQFDQTTCARIQPFVGGRFVIIVGQMAPMMQQLHPTASDYMRILFTSTIIGVDGFADDELDVEEVQALTAQNSYQVVTKASGNTQSLSLTFMTIFQGTPIYRYITKWMKYIQNRGSGVSSYPHLTAAMGNPLEYHEGNHSMTMAYIVVDPSMRYVEEGAFCYSMVPTNNQASSILNQTWGESAPKQLVVPFKVKVITAAQHEAIRELLTSALTKWTRDIALDDEQVVINDILNG